jgi:deazaflavin-dependent oxidoreductase (nitroreductase family)
MDNDQIIEEFRAHEGKVGGMFASMELLLLTTTGAKSGQPRTLPLAYTRDGDDYVIVASKGGADTNPDWYLNLLAHPEVQVEAGSDKLDLIATPAKGDDKERLYAQHAAVYPMFLEYRQKTSRDIPLIVLHKA